MDQSAEKGLLRRQLLEMRRRLSFEDVLSLSSLVQQNFMETGYFRSAGRISLYSSFNNEVLTDRVFQRSAEDNKEVYFPRLIRTRRHLAFFKVEKIEDLRPGSYEVLEPAEGGHRVEPEALDLIVVPGAAFDTRGNRVGYGKGYYDMALRDVRCPVVALAYDFQLMDGLIPSEKHDVRLTAIVTEKRVVEAGVF